MLSSRLQRWIVALFLMISGANADAQNVAPNAANDVSVGGPAGLTSPITPTGGYSTSVPISLPPPRGRFALPFSIDYTGTNRAGAAGAGWEVPLVRAPFGDDVASQAVRRDAG